MPRNADLIKRLLIKLIGYYMRKVLCLAQTDQNLLKCEFISQSFKISKMRIRFGITAPGIHQKRCSYRNKITELIFESPCNRAGFYENRCPAPNQS